MNLTLPKRRTSTSPRDPEDLIRAELFSIERLEQHGETLAAAQPILPGLKRGKRLVSRLIDNGRLLRSAFRSISGALREERSITPAAEWLVDNFHVVEDQIRHIREELQGGYYRQLPKLANGPLAGYPRVYGIAWAFVAHTDSLFDPQALTRFVRAYQKVQPLTIGELWAVAITIRIVLVENLRRAAEGIVHRRIAREEADTLAEALLDPGTPSERLLERHEHAPLSVAFAVQLLQRLRDQDPEVTPSLR